MTAIPLGIAVGMTFDDKMHMMMLMMIVQFGMSSACPIRSMQCISFVWLILCKRLQL